MQKIVLGIAAAAAAVTAMTGCVSRTYEKEVVTAPAQPTVVQAAPAPAPAPAVIVATAPPPPLQQEAIPPSPGPDMVWVPGYWTWANGQYNWVPGRYEAGRVGYQWVPQRWENVNGQWTMTGGAWVRR